MHLRLQIQFCTHFLFFFFLLASPDPRPPSLPSLLRPLSTSIVSACTVPPTRSDCRTCSLWTFFFASYPLPSRAHVARLASFLSASSNHENEYNRLNSTRPESQPHRLQRINSNQQTHIELANLIRREVGYRTETRGGGSCLCMVIYNFVQL
jgi:hypothetical protein